MQTNLTKIREETIKLFDSFPLMPAQGIKNTGAICHPFAKSIFFYHHTQKKWLDISTPNGCTLYRRFILDKIDSLSLPFIYDMILDDYKLTWFQLCKDYMSREDFAYYLKHSWLDEEDPNQDPTVSREEVIRYFRQADKQYLMKPDDLAHYQNLPDTLTIYRGVSPHRAKFGLSWTADQNIAMWFKKRYEGGSQGQLLTAVISKKHVLAYIDERNEQELIVDVFKIQPQIYPFTGSCL